MIKTDKLSCLTCWLLMRKCYKTDNCLCGWIHMYISVKISFYLYHLVNYELLNGGSAPTSSYIESTFWK